MNPKHPTWYAEALLRQCTEYEKEIENLNNLNALLRLQKKELRKELLKYKRRKFHQA